MTESGAMRDMLRDSMKNDDQTPLFSEDHMTGEIEKGHQLDEHSI